MRIRRWSIYLVLIFSTLLLGLASRKFAPWLPSWIAAYAGDTLWALLIFWLIGLLRPSWSSKQVAATAWGFAFGIEISQLYQAPWLNAIRATTLGGLVLGYSFLWSDLVCYSMGVLAGYLLEKSKRLWQ
ncbi:DUF2809 domain-containing protein [Hymenobacter aerilatus]|uniref:DUF2809 domain-containing protein n=1 Tax=Hymenobacter aerilatus TaxID=2932251 RepID=A0A8T9T1U7_9BACT|nr:DUF2809 domain-containing protein [Hymenobacter aerilatus]UOR05969.1 DUF2809 domain-containing protein [Hymenobacter aerilatus]